MCHTWLDANLDENLWNSPYLAIFLTKTLVNGLGELSLSTTTIPLLINGCAHGLRYELYICIYKLFIHQIKHMDG